eukprot:1144254-Pelagomonas_calceolata.AAC.1
MENRIPRAEALCIPFTKRSKGKDQWGSGGKKERSLVKSVYGANKSISVLDRMGMKLQSKPGGCMGVKTKLFKRLQSVRGVDDPAHTLQNRVEGIFTVSDLHKMDVSLSWRELTGVMDLGSRQSGCGLR